MGTANTKNWLVGRTLKKQAERAESAAMQIFAATRSFRAYSTQACSKGLFPTRTGIDIKPYTFVGFLNLYNYHPPQPTECKCTQCIHGNPCYYSTVKQRAFHISSAVPEIKARAFYCYSPSALFNILHVCMYTIQR